MQHREVKRLGYRLRVSDLLLKGTGSHILHRRLVSEIIHREQRHTCPFLLAQRERPEERPRRKC